MRQNIVTIIAPLDGSPAQKAGLMAGDKVLKVDGEDTIEMTLDQAVSKMRGQKNTEVTLTVFRNNGDEETLDITITRGVIDIASVELLDKDGFAHLKIRQFGEETEKEFKKAVSDITRAQYKGIIIDLRNNPGGFLGASIEMADYLLPMGKVVVIEEDHDGNQKKTYTRGNDKLSSIYTVILINEGSASASEILAGALRDNRDNVTVVGKKSFGKGSVQELISLPRATAVKITVAKWLTPNGVQINQEGIEPDIEVERTSEDYENDREPQLDRAIEILKEKTQS
jgi:carboxyl-terminal processing protease